MNTSSAQSGGRGTSVKIEELSTLGSGKIPKPPGVKERIERLMKLATELDEAGTKPSLARKLTFSTAQEYRAARPA